MPSNTRSPHPTPPVTPQSKLAADVLAAASVLRGLVAGLQPKDVPLSWAPEVLAAFHEVERVAVSGQVLMTARAVEAEAWRRERFASAAEWLAAQRGTTTGRARADLDTSERLGGLDATADAVREGLLSPEQAGAIADAAVVNPAAEQDLLDGAQNESLRRTRREAERRKAEATSERAKADRDERVRRERCARFWYSNGAGHLEMRGPVAAVKELEQLIQREVDRRFRAHRVPKGSKPTSTRQNFAFDAVVDLARGGGSGTVSKAPLTRMTLVKVDLAALKRGSVGDGEVCEIGGVAVSVAELRRTLGESVLQLVLTNGDAVIDVVNLNRKPTVAQMIAKLFTDSCCTVEGCDRAARLEFDHRHDWARVLVTELANLDLLCDHHHHLKTHEGWQLATGTGRRPMIAPTPRSEPEPEPEPEPETRPDTADLLAQLAGQHPLFDSS